MGSRGLTTGVNKPVGAHAFNASRVADLRVVLGRDPNVQHCRGTKSVEYLLTIGQVDIHDRNMTARPDGQCCF